MELEWTLTLSDIADGEAAQALAQGLRTPQQAPAIAAPFQAEGGKGAGGTKNQAFPAAQGTQGMKGGTAGRLPHAAGAQGVKGPPVTYLPAATLAQGDKNPPLN